MINFANILKHKPIMWMAVIIPAALLITSIVRISQGKYVNILGIEWNENKTGKNADITSKMETVSGNDDATIISGNKNKTNITYGNESPNMNGVGDYKPTKITKKAEIDSSKQIDIKNSKNVIVGGSNNYVGDTYYRVPDRKISDPEIATMLERIIEEIPNKDYPIQLHIKDDEESLALADEIEKTLRQEQFKNIKFSLFSSLAGVRLGEMSGRKSQSRSGEDQFLIIVQENKH